MGRRPVVGVAVVRKRPPPLRRAGGTIRGRAVRHVASVGGRGGRGDAREGEAGGGVPYLMKIAHPGFAGSGESGDDNLQRAAEIEAKAFSAAERQGGDGAADAAVVREYSRAAREMMTRAIDDVDGVSADDDDASSASSSSSEDEMSGRNVHRHSQ